MHVTLYQPGKIPVPPPPYGSTQRLVYWLGKTLLEMGHQVTLIANRRSHIPGAELRVVPDREEDPHSWQQLVPETTDIVHLQSTPRTALKKPFLVTIHGNGRPGEVFHPNTVFVSRKNAAHHGTRHFVYNGIDPAEYGFSGTRGHYAVFLARARRNVKNLEGAIAVARKAGIELRVMGSRNWPLNLHRLLPAIRGVRYYGMIGGETKRELLARARCLIFPVRWHEPFGLALTEALVSGCYVAGTPYGSLPEIVPPETGILSSSAADLAEAVRDPSRFNPQTCRQRVLEGGFTRHDMARKYLAYYENILTHGRLGEAGEPAPATIAGFDAKELLPWTD